MATDLAEILADLRAETSRSPRHDPSAATDARVALSRLRPALDRLGDDGLDTGATFDVDPDAFSRQADRVHWVRLLATTCDTLGQSVPTPARHGRLTDLADAAAVAATLHVDSMTGGERWATVAALARTAHVLTDAAAGGGEHESPEASRALIIAEASSSVLFQFASLDPPSAADNTALHRPVPNPAREATSVEDAVLEASAGLVHATRPGTGLHPISDILAIATAATTACRFVERAQRAAGDDHLAAAARDAALAWGEVREQLAPFNDGSRRPQRHRPPTVESALALHRSLRQPTTPEPTRPWPGTAPDQRIIPGVATVVDRLAVVAVRLGVAVDDAVACGRLMSHAVDLPMREARVRPFLEGHRATGLVAADADDLAPVRSSLHRAQVDTATLAATLPALGLSARPDADHAALHDPRGRSIARLSVSAPARDRTPGQVATTAPRSDLLSHGPEPTR